MDIRRFSAIGLVPAQASDHGMIIKFLFQPGMPSVSQQVVDAGFQFLSASLKIPQSFLWLPYKPDSKTDK